MFSMFKKLFSRNRRARPKRKLFMSPPVIAKPLTVSDGERVTSLPVKPSRERITQKRSRKFNRRAKNRLRRSPIYKIGGDVKNQYLR